jgi:hypothetical protein
MSVIILCMLSFYRCVCFNMILLCNSWEVLCPLHLLFTPNFSVCISTVSVGSLSVLLHNWWQVLSQVCPLVIAQILLHSSFNQYAAHVATLWFFAWISWTYCCLEAGCTAVVRILRVSLLINGKVLFCFACYILFNNCYHVRENNFKWNCNMRIKNYIGCGQKWL